MTFSVLWNVYEKTTNTDRNTLIKIHTAFLTVVYVVYSKQQSFRLPENIFLSNRKTVPQKWMHFDVEYHSLPSKRIVVTKLRVERGSAARYVFKIARHFASTQRTRYRTKYLVTCVCNTREMTRASRYVTTCKSYNSGAPFHPFLLFAQNRCIAVVLTRGRLLETREVSW